MKALFGSMLREEWRIHSTAFGNRYFGLFPVIILFCTGGAMVFVPFFLQVISVNQLVLSAHYVFVLFGVSIGAFGLFGKEIMNRRFGQASLIAYSARSLPVSERQIFAAFFVKDVVFYVFLWLAPIVVGIVGVGWLLGFSVFSLAFICGTLVLSFLFGLSVVFLLSTVYAYSGRVVIGLIFSILVANVVVVHLFDVSVNVVLLGYMLYRAPSLFLFGALVGFCVVCAVLSIVFVNIEYPESKKYRRNQLLGLSWRLRGFRYNVFMAKDLLDLHRSEGGLGKILFSFLLPVIFTYVFLEVFVGVIPGVSGLMMFAIFLGIVSASLYNMLTAFDSFNPYVFLPVRMSMVLKSKVQSFLLFNVLSVVVLLVVAVLLDQLVYVVPALLLFVSLCVYALGVTVFLTGVQPNILMYNSKVFVPYLVLLGSVLFVVTFVSIINPVLMMLSPVLVPVAWWFLRKGFVKWDAWVPQTI